MTTWQVVNPRHQTPQGQSVTKPETPSWIARCDINGSVSTVLNPIFSKKVRGQKHLGKCGIVEHQIPSIKVLFKTNTKGHKHPSIRLFSKSKTQLVNQRKQKVAFSPGTAHSPEIQSCKTWWGEWIIWLLQSLSPEVSTKPKYTYRCDICTYGELIENKLYFLYHNPNACVLTWSYLGFRGINVLCVEGVYMTKIYSYKTTMSCKTCQSLPGFGCVLWPLLLTWFNFNPSMDK